MAVAAGRRFGFSVIGMAMTLTVVVTGCSGGTATSEPSPPVTTVSSSASSAAYDLGGRDVAAICAQLKVFADRWDATPPTGASEQEKAAFGRQIVEEMVTAAGRLRALAPPNLADDIQAQVVALQGMVAQFMPSASITAPVPSVPPRDAKSLDAAQKRINALS